MHRQTFSSYSLLETGSQKKLAVKGKRCCADRETEQQHNYLSRGEGCCLGESVLFRFVTMRKCKPVGIHLLEISFNAENKNPPIPYDAVVIAK